MQIFTLGYEGIDVASFIKILIQNDIETVVDVRQMPLSRKFGFSKTTLSNLLQKSGLRYQHIACLGCPKTIRDRYRQDNDWSVYKDCFLSYLNTQDETLFELSDLTYRSNCVLICYESDYNFCHRNLIAQTLQQRFGTRIQHLKSVQIKTSSIETRSFHYAE